MHGVWRSLYSGLGIDRVANVYLRGYCTVQRIKFAAEFSALVRIYTGHYHELFVRSTLIKDK